MTLVEEVADYRRAIRSSLRAQAADLRSSIPLEERPIRPSKSHPMYDYGVQICEGLGYGTAARSVFASSKRTGIELDLWLEVWNERRQVVPEILSGEDYSAVVEDVVSLYRSIADLGRESQGIISRGTSSYHLAEGDPLAEEWLTGTPEEAAVVLASTRGEVFNGPVPDADPVGVLEISQRLGVKRQTVSMWQLRKLLPPARWTVSGREAWNWHEIEEWARKTGRLD